MKTSKSELLSVVMDDIRDANMMFDYAEHARMEGDDTLRHWFMTKAEERAHMAEAEWHDAYKVLGLESKDDDTSWCLKHHVEHEMSRLKGRMK